MTDSWLRILTLLPLLLPLPATALESKWLDMKPARYRLVAASVGDSDHVALQIDLKPGWHTYWRYPGASGMAPEFSFSGSGGKVGPAVYPAPYFFDDGVGGYYGYQNSVGFVFPLQKSGSGKIEMQASFGVCREVCVPVDLTLSLDMNERFLAGSPHGRLIGNWLAAQPGLPSAELRLEGATFDGATLQVVVAGRDLQNPQVMSVPGPHDIIGQPRVAARHPEAFLIEIPAWSKLDHPLIGRKLTFVVRDGARAIEQEIEIRDHRLLPQDDPLPPMGDKP